MCWSFRGDFVCACADKNVPLSVDGPGSFFFAKGLHSPVCDSLGRRRSTDSITAPSQFDLTFATVLPEIARGFPRGFLSRFGNCTHNFSYYRRSAAGGWSGRAGSDQASLSPISRITAPGLLVRFALISFQLKLPFAVKAAYTPTANSSPFLVG